MNNVIIGLLSIFSIFMIIYFSRKQGRYFAWIFVIIQFLEIRILDNNFLTVPKIGLVLMVIILFTTYGFSIKNLKKEVLFLVVLWWFFYLISVLWAIQSGYTLSKIVNMFILLIVAVIVAFCVYRFGDVRGFFEGFILLTIISSAITIGQYLSWLPENLNFTNMVNITQRMGGLKVNPNENAFQLGLGAIMIFVNLSLPQKSRLLIKPYLLNLFLFGLISLSILTTQSRSGILAFSAALSLSSMIIIINSKNKISVICSLLPIILIVITIFLSQTTLINQVFSRFELASIDKWSGRETLNKYAWDFFLDKPIFGNGLGSFLYLVEPYLGSRAATHNTYLEVLVDGGIIGGFFFFLILVNVARYLLSILQQKQFIMFNLFAAEFILLLVMMVSGSLLYNKNLWIMLGMVIGFSSLNYRKAHPKIGIAHGNLNSIP